MSENSSNGVQYRLNFVNNSANAGTFMVFQQTPDMQVENVNALAWITKYANPGVQGFFSWSTENDFVWFENDSPVPGINSGTSQCVPANLETSNQISLTYNSGYQFADQTSGEPVGSLYIKMDSTVPLKQASVGIGMSGAATFVVPAQPNMNLTFTPHPEYWIAFGNFEQGEVLDMQELTNTEKIDFPPGIQEMTVTLNQDNTWKVEVS
ncbi:hypothetical protein D3C71_1068170 [compost metagenome]